MWDADVDVDVDVRVLFAIEVIHNTMQYNTYKQSSCKRDKSSPCRCVLRLVLGHHIKLA